MKQNWWRVIGSYVDSYWPSFWAYGVKFLIIEKVIEDYELGNQSYSDMMSRHQPHESPRYGT